jgi:hypothetical protein
MPVIKVFSPHPHAAAAVMGAMSAKLAEPAAPQKSSRPEGTQRGNPNRLTLRQHVFPTKSIERFANERKRVSLHDLLRSKVRSTKPRDAIFCANRAWDERTETAMKRTEDLFQSVVEPIINGEATFVNPEQKPIVDQMYALWHMRALYRDLEAQEVRLNEITGETLTKAEEEILETKHYVFVRANGMMPARQLNGITLQARIHHYVETLNTSVDRWGIISTQEGEFIVPDIPHHGIFPITPRLALVKSSPDGMITRENLVEINRVMKEASNRYFFARDFADSPF